MKVFRKGNALVRQDDPRILVATLSDGLSEDEADEFVIEQSAGVDAVRLFEKYKDTWDLNLIRRFMEEWHELYDWHEYAKSLTRKET